MDIHSKGKWPRNALSNFYPHQFMFDGVLCGSMEGFLQSLKIPSIIGQREICALKGKEAKLRSTEEWKADQTLYWKGKNLKRDSDAFQALLRMAYHAMYEQCPEFREALRASRKKILFHSIGNPIQQDTILTEKELCDILTELRSQQ